MQSSGRAERSGLGDPSFLRPREAKARKSNPSFPRRSGLIKRIVLIVAVVLLFLCCCCCCYGYRRYQKKKRGAKRAPLDSAASVA